MMLAVRLHGPSDLRVDQVPEPGPPGSGQVLLRVKAVGVCGSDLHTYHDGRIGDTIVRSPLILGHEFAGIVDATGPEAIDGLGGAAVAGSLVAVDPAWPCGVCEPCRRGNPNLCLDLHFAGQYPDQGALCERMLVPARACFPLAAGTNPAVGALLETLGVALHAVDLGHVRVGDTVAVLGAGPIGLSILQVLRHAGAHPILVTDKLPSRLDLARRLGGVAIACDDGDPVQAVVAATGGRGVDCAIEAAWADQSIQQAAAMARPGGRLVLVGIPGDDRLALQHSTARRKGLTIRLSRRMKHTYPRALDLHARGAVDLAAMISHRLPLAQTPQAFELAAGYRQGVVKVVIDM
jgi:L-iditol 2-dehydrogenase